MAYLHEIRILQNPENRNAKGRVLMPCEHKRRTNFAVCRDGIQHEYCPDCGWHLFGGREYTKAEWFSAFIAEDDRTVAVGREVQGELF